MTPAQRRSGSTLALAYAQAHPAHVLGLVLVAVTTTSRSEVDWITERVGCAFPEAGTVSGSTQRPSTPPTGAARAGWSRRTPG
ncbi:MAG: hypothetical protein ACRCYX_14760 [Dermatophilaceae bacterium]